MRYDPKERIKETKKRKKETRKQKDIFMKVFLTYGAKSMLSGKFIPQIRASCFPHLLPKGMYPEYKYEFNNIAIVFDENEHLEVDRLVNGNKLLVKNMIDYGYTALEIINKLKGQNINQKK